MPEAMHAAGVGRRACLVSSGVICQKRLVRSVASSAWIHFGEGGTVRVTTSWSNEHDAHVGHIVVEPKAQCTSRRPCTYTGVAWSDGGVALLSSTVVLMASAWRIRIGVRWCGACYRRLYPVFPFRGACQLGNSYIYICF